LKAPDPPNGGRQRAGAGAQRANARESYVRKAASRRCLSAWRLRRESHSRTPYPSAKPIISTIAVSGIGSPPIRELEVMIKSHQTYTNLTGRVQTDVCCRSLSSVVKRHSERCRRRPNSDVLVDDTSLVGGDKENDGRLAIMRAKALSAVSAVFLLSLVSVDGASAAEGCGPGFHRGPYGGCRPNGPVVVAPGAPVVVAPAVVAPAVVCGVGYRWHPRWRRCVVL
jgi:hypothetical protein